MWTKKKRKQSVQHRYIQLVFALKFHTTYAQDLTGQPNRCKQQEIEIIEVLRAQPGQWQLAH